MKIALISNNKKPKIEEATQKILDILLNCGHTVFSSDKNFINNEKLIYTEDEYRLSELCDIFITLGGDGTIIYTSKIANGKPILGINLGRLGYMTCLEFHEIEKLPLVLSGDFYYEDRMLIDVRIDEKVVGTVLNDGVISAQLARLLDFDVVISGSKFSYRADGIIISTPTGSTAYSLSAGGPVVDPSISCMLFTPICPHSLFNRSIAFSPDTVLKVKANPKYNEKVILTLDGGEPIEINDQVSFTASNEKVHLILNKKHNFLRLVNKKFFS